MNILFYQILAYIINVKKWYNNNKLKISAPMWHEPLKIPDGSYSIINIQDYFEYILKSLGKRPLVLQ